jgi:hypothetical protein
VGRNYRAILEPRFHGLVDRWLRKLPPAGWSGTPRELAAALAAESTFGEYVGRNVVSQVVAATHTLSEAGLETLRTASRRLVTIRRVRQTKLSL